MAAQSPTRAAVYLRISLDPNGRQEAIERQRDACRAIANSRGWTVVDEYADNSISAYRRDAKRPEYDRMVADFDAGRFDALICYDLDRLTRQPRQLEDWIEAAEDRGLKLVTANGEADLTTDGGRMFARLKAAVARSEVERKGQRQRDANRQRADKGRPPSGVRLTGYEQDGTVRPTEAAIVRRVFEQFAAGDTLKGIAEGLTGDAVPTRSGGERWHSSTVRTMLTNPRYAGRAVYQGRATSKAGEWEPIVSEALFDAVQARLRDPRRVTNRAGTDRKYLGSGIYRCGVCDGPLRTNGARYWCPVGGHVTRGLEPIDDMVARVVTARLRQPDARDILNRPDDEVLAAADAEAAELRHRLTAIEADYDGGLIDGRRYAVAVEKVETQLRVVEERRAAALLGTAVAGVLAAPDPAAAWVSASLAQRRAVVEALMTVRVLPAPQGRRGFDPESVTIEWEAS